MTYSLVIPVYRNESSIQALVEAVDELAGSLDEDLEAVFVVDGSPDTSADLLRKLLPGRSFHSKLIEHSRNFGSFPAIHTGLSVATGEYFAVIAADLQEPMSLPFEFYRRLESGSCDVVVGVRRSRQDGVLSGLFSRAFWFMFRRLVFRDLPRGGVDVFGCNRVFRDNLINLRELRSSLIGLVYWLGFRRESVQYDRAARHSGRSAWSWRRRMRYLTDSIFAFTDLPIRLLLIAGAIGLAVALALGVAAVTARLTGIIPVPGYTATIVAVTFFAALNSLGFGIIGSYASRALANTTGRPVATVREIQAFEPSADSTGASDGGIAGTASLIPGVAVIPLSPHRDLRGAIAVAELDELLPFRVRRAFLVHAVPSLETRGEHAHRVCHQFLVCTHGSCSVVVDDGTTREEITLDDPNRGVYLPPMVWSTQYRYSPDAVLLVLASHPYDAEDYIRDYDQFIEARRLQR